MNHDESMEVDTNDHHWHTEHHHRMVHYRLEVCTQQQQIHMFICNTMIWCHWPYWLLPLFLNHNNFIIINHQIRCQTILAPSRLHLGENNTILLISDKDSEATLKVVEKGFTQPILSHTIHFRKGRIVLCLFIFISVHLGCPRVQ